MRASCDLFILIVLHYSTCIICHEMYGAVKYQSMKCIKQYAVTYLYELVVDDDAMCFLQLLVSKDVKLHLPSRLDSVGLM